MNKSVLRIALSAMCFVLSCTPQEQIEKPEKEEPEEINYELSFETPEYHVSIGRSGEISCTFSPEDAQVEYSVTDESIFSITEVEEVEQGLCFHIEGKNLGSSTLVAAVGDKLASCKVYVEEVAVEQIVLDKTELALIVNDSYSLGVKVEPSDATYAEIEWSSSDESVAVVDHGIVSALSEGEAQIKATCGQVYAVCQVNVGVIKAESLTLDKDALSLVEGESYLLTATALPENVSYKNFKWSCDKPSLISYEVIDAVESDNAISVKLTALQAGSCSLSVSMDGLSATCAIEIQAKEVPIIPAKVGDYFYSDGTWSDGGLISMDKDGCNQVWADPKPAPLEGKIVIGIVFQTDESRISDKEKALGCTHGLVLCTKAAHARGEKLTRYSFEYNFETVPVCRLGTSWYADIDGYTWTHNIMEEFATNIQQCPAFDWVTTDFSPAAPENTSDWYIPSIGQLWDAIANLCGSEVAEKLKELRSYSSDATYYSYYNGDIVFDFDLIAKLNSAWALVDASQKEDFFASTFRNGYGIAEIMSSSLYDNSDGNSNIFWLGDNGLLEPTASW
ncbi:MAG: Ig domain-containing protein, partial [Candidatus Cryptobacteroides sp.]